MTPCITMLSGKLLWIFGLTALLGLLVHLGSGDALSLGRYTAYLMPWFLVILVPGFGWSLLTRHWSLAILLALSLGIVLRAYAPLLSPRQSVLHAASSELKVMSFNVWSKNPNPSRIAATVSEHGLDILLLQEIMPTQFETLSQALAKQTAATGVVWSQAYDPKSLQAVISRYRLTSHWSNVKKAKVQVVSAETPLGPVMIFNVHPTWGNSTRRDRQLSDLLYEDILPCELPVILGGDFNTTDQSEIFKRLIRHLHNAHWEAGSGFGFSFPASLNLSNGIVPFFPLLRIDHLFFNDHFFALEAATTADSYGSDHFPVTARLAFNPDHGNKQIVRHQ